MSPVVCQQIETFFYNYFLFIQFTVELLLVDLASGLLNYCKNVSSCLPKQLVKYYKGTVRAVIFLYCAVLSPRLVYLYYAVLSSMVRASKPVLCSIILQGTGQYTCTEQYYLQGYGLVYLYCAVLSARVQASIPVLCSIISQGTGYSIPVLCSIISQSTGQNTCTVQYYLQGYGIVYLYCAVLSPRVRASIPVLSSIISQGTGQ